MTVDNTGFFGNQAIGGAASGAGNEAGIGVGGAIQNFGTLSLTDCTLAANEAKGGAGPTAPRAATARAAASTTAGPSR